MRTRYNRGSFDSGLMKLLIFVIAVPTVFSLVLGLFSKSAPAGNPTPPAPAIPAPTPFDDGSVVTLCNEKQLAAYGLSPSDQGVKTEYQGFNSDSASTTSDAD